MLEHVLHMTAASPFVQVVIIILATFVLEDAATLITAIQVQLHVVSLPTALVALYSGIVLGDVGLYGLGALAACWPPARRWIDMPGISHQRQWLSRNLFRAVFVSRFIPGTRLPLYTACGFFRAGLQTFTLATALATLLWTTGLFFLALKIGAFLLAHLGAWRWAGIVGFAAIMILSGRVAARIRKNHTP